jgi:hypothetical protein
MKNPRGGARNKLNQDLKNQIKNMLLCNGWKLNYWSITKAYAVFQEQLQKSRGYSSELNNIER